MAVRGTAYCLPPDLAPNTVAALVVTNDVWNRVMRAATIVPLIPAEAAPDHSGPLLSGGEPLVAAVGRIRPIEQYLLREAYWTFAWPEMALVEEALRELFALPHLRASRPRQPPSPPGPVDYARWGQVYYRNEPIAGERKRFVVVSRDDLEQGLAHCCLRSHYQPDETP